MDKGKIFAIIAIGLILISGCIGEGDGNGGKNESNQSQDSNITIVNITIDYGQKNTTINETENNTEKQDYSIYSYEPKRTLNIYFLQLSSGQKSGRAVLIKKGDFDMLIDGGILESYEKLHSLANSISDDFEIYVISSNSPENIENSMKIVKNFKIAELWYGDEKE